MERFLFRELLHIPLLVRSDTSLLLIGAQERTGSICCQNQIILCQQSRRESRRLSQACGHTHAHTLCVLRFDHYGSVKGRPVVIYYLFIGNFVVRSAKPNCSSLGIGVGLVRIHYQLVLCPAALWQTRDGGDCPELKLPVSQEGNDVPAWAVQNHSQSIYGTLSQISLGGDATFHRVALSLSEGLPAVINRSGI